MADDGTEAVPAADVPQVTFKKRSAKAKTSLRKKAATPPPAGGSDSDFTSSDDDEGRRIKRRRKNATVTASSASNNAVAAAQRKADDDSAIYAAAAPLVSSNDATKQSNWYDETEDKALSAKELLGKTRASATATAPSADGTYRGTGNYQSFVRKNPDAPTKQFGPTKASTNVRTITITDMAPDVCVDYKKSGFCGFGDSCKFAHMREDYQHGWELDRDWEIKTKGKKVAGQTVSSREKKDKGAGDDDDEYDDKLLESIPFACIICKKSYKNPIITKCGHYFCESCALQRYRKNPSCAACGAGTGGVFNVSKKLNQLLDKKRERARKRREEAIANGEEVEGGEEEAIEAES